MSNFNHHNNQSRKKLARESKHNKFKTKYLDNNGQSDFIERYKLPKPFAWTSGDSIFRMDSAGILSKELKFITVKKTKKKPIRYTWKPTNEEKENIEQEVSNLVFPKKPGNAVHWIKFYGWKKQKDIQDQGIRKDIINHFKGHRCANCHNSDDVQVDHKNDLKNDPRVLNKKTQKISDFQPLCGKCNCITPLNI